MTPKLETRQTTKRLKLVAQCHGATPCVGIWYKLFAWICSSYGKTWEMLMPHTPLRNLYFWMLASHTSLIVLMVLYIASLYIVCLHLYCQSSCHSPKSPETNLSAPKLESKCHPNPMNRPTPPPICGFVRALSPKCPSWWCYSVLIWQMHTLHQHLTWFRMPKGTGIPICGPHMSSCPLFVSIFLATTCSFFNVPILWFPYKTPRQNRHHREGLIAWRSGGRASIRPAETESFWVGSEKKPM